VTHPAGIFDDAALPLFPERAAAFQGVPLPTGSHRGAS
jgi:hypothetical protein